MKLPLFSELISKFKNKNIEQEIQKPKANFYDEASKTFLFLQELSELNKYPELEHIIDSEVSEHHEQTKTKSSFNNITLQQKTEIIEDMDGYDINTLKKIEYEFQLDNYNAKIKVNTYGFGANGEFAVSLQTKTGNDFIKINATFMGNEVRGVYDNNANIVSTELAKEVINNDLFSHLKTYTDGMKQAITEIKQNKENEQNNKNNDIQNDIETTIQKIKMKR